MEAPGGVIEGITSQHWVPHGSNLHRNKPKVSFGNKLAVYTHVVCGGTTSVGSGGGRGGSGLQRAEEAEDGRGTG